MVVSGFRLGVGSGIPYAYAYEGLGVREGPGLLISAGGGEEGGHTTGYNEVTPHEA